MTLLISLLAALVVGLLGLLVVDAVPGANMRFFNPRQMQTAGTPGAFAGILKPGSAEVVVEGVAYGVDRPELVPMTEVVNDLPPGDRRLMSLFGVGQALRLHRVGVVEPGRNGGSSHE
jgi:hypothetical protein